MASNAYTTFIISVNCIKLKRIDIPLLEEDSMEHKNALSRSILTWCASKPFTQSIKSYLKQFQASALILVSTQINIPCYILSFCYPPSHTRALKVTSFFTTDKTCGSWVTVPTVWPLFTIQFMSSPKSRCWTHPFLARTNLNLVSHLHHKPTFIWWGKTWTIISSVKPCSFE